MIAGFARPWLRRLLPAVALGAAALAAGIGLLATAAWLITRAAQHPPESALALAIVVVQFFGLAKGPLRYGQRLLGHDAALRALSHLRTRVFTRAQEVAPAGLPEGGSGEMMARFVRDVGALQDLLLSVISPVAVALACGAVVVAAVWAMLPAAGLILLSALALAATGLPWLSGRLARRRRARGAQARGELTSAVVDLVAGAPELIVHGSGPLQLARAAAADAQLGRVARGDARTAGVGQGLAALLPGLAMVASLVVGIAAVRDGRLDIALLPVIAVVALGCAELTGGLPAAAQALVSVRDRLRRVDQVLDAPAPVADPPAPRPLPADCGRVRVRGLRCRYGDGPWVLDGLDLDLAPGRRVAIVGRSGAGKSTLAAVLLRFVPYQGGSVTVGGTELDQLRGEDCRRAIGLLAQDAHLFNTTIEANLRLAAPDAEPAQIARSLCGAHLAGWVDELPQGLGTDVGEFGARVSGGQRQRLAAARVLLAEFPVLVLDEPAEHLDTDTGDELVADLLEACEDQAILLITHRLAGLPEVDEVVVLDRGRAVERGSHAELLARGGVYAEMWRRENW